LDEDALQNCTNTVDSSLNDVYQEGREENLIGPIELRVIKEGTFEELKALAVKAGANPVQYKQPRCLSNPQRLQLLNDKTLVSYRSTSAIVRPGLEYNI
jgi:auxin responsive GH3 family protein